MKVRIGNLEVSDLTLEELDALVQRYGSPTVSFEGVGGNGGDGSGPIAQPPLLSEIDRVDIASVFPDKSPKGKVMIGGKWMTPAEVAAYRKRLASPTPLPGINND